MKLVLTCEHGGNNIPKEFTHYFRNHETVLSTHRGFDLGALDVFKTLKPLSDFSASNETSRLLIEYNRSLHNNNLFSEFSKELSKAEKELLITDFYLVYRNNVEKHIKNFIDSGETVLHLSVHSFTPVLNSKTRNCDIGLLFDSRIPSEKQICKNLKEHILKINPNYKVRFNYPYLGKADGFTTYLRTQFQENYLGIELEINQKFSKKNIMDSIIKIAIFSAIQNLMS